MRLGNSHSTLALVVLIFNFGSFGNSAAAQHPSDSTPSPKITEASSHPIPRTVKYSGALLNAVEDQANTSGVALTFALYEEQSGGAPLWLETQTVTPDAQGNYFVLLGSMREDGLPQDVFTSNEARWLGVRLNGGNEQPRVLLVSVPYAMKAGDAETLGGLPASAFMLQPAALKDRVERTGGLVGDGLSTAAVSGTGTTNRITKWLDGVGTLGDSIIHDTGTLVGIGTTTPGAALDISLDGAALILGGTGTHSLALQGALSNGRFGQDSEGVFFASDSNSKVFKFLTNNGTLNENMRIASNGFVGIGTNLPGATLDVAQDNASIILRGTGTHSFSLQGALSNGRFGQDSEGMFFASDTNGKAFKFLTNNGALNEWMRITSAGNVGIGTNAPTQKLDVAGNIWSSGTVTAASFSGDGSGLTNLPGGGGGIGGSGTVNRIPKFTAATTLGDSLIFDNGTNVGIGTTTPANRLDVRSAATAAAVYGENSTNMGTGIYGKVTATTSAGVSPGSYGGFFTNASSSGAGVYGLASSTANVLPTYGVYGVSSGPQGRGVYGFVNNGAAAYGGYFETTSTTGGTAAFGYASDSGAGFSTGVWGQSNSSNGIGVRGTSGSGSGTTYGGYFSVNNATGIAGYFNNQAAGDILQGWVFNDLKFKVAGNGNVTADGTFTGGGADFAESVAVLNGAEAYEPGDVMIVDTTANRRFALAREPYSSLVTGIYSTKPGMLGSLHSMDARQLAQEVPMAVVGIVPTKVSAENGPIERGDLLVTSSVPGHAMKGTDRSRMLGAIVGKALEPLAEGTGVIEVLVTLQ